MFVLFSLYLLSQLFQYRFYFLKELPYVRSIYKSMAYGESNGYNQSSFAWHYFAGIHQRIVQWMVGSHLRVGERSEIKLRRGAQLDDVKITLLCNHFFGSIRVAVFGNMMDDVVCCGIKMLKILVVRDADGVESLAGDGDG